MSLEQVLAFAGSASTEPGYTAWSGVRYAADPRKELAEMVTIERASEVFVHGFAFTRSLTHPCVAEPVGPDVWVLRDAPQAHGAPRVEEYVAYGVPAAALAALARQHTHGRFRLCVIRTVRTSDDGIRADFPALGYRLMTTESFMLHRLNTITTAVEPFPVTQVTTLEQARLLWKTARSRRIMLERLMADPAPMRQYMALDNGTPVGWVSSVVVDDCTWCTGMFVKPEYRRRGIARALLTRMLGDDKIAGAKASVLLASHAGSALYPQVGYEQIGALLMFVPPKSATAGAI
jgi:GNAT superfamily N-acetyltransferase